MIDIIVRKPGRFGSDQVFMERVPSFRYPLVGERVIIDDVDHLVEYVATEVPAGTVTIQVVES